MDTQVALAELIGTFTLVFVGRATAVFAGSVYLPAIFTKRAR